MKKTRILLADDHLVVRMGLAAIIDCEKDLSVVGEAEDGAKAVEMARTLKPDVVVMDLMMPRMNGADATAAIRSECPVAKVLVLTTFSDSGDVRRALDAGASGAIVKDTSYDGLIAAIRTAAAGRRIVSPEIEGAISAKSDAPKLSTRQIEILRLAAKGLSYGEIARLLDIGIDCVKYHMRTAFASLGASTRSEAVATAVNLGLIQA